MQNKQQDINSYFREKLLSPHYFPLEGFLINNHKNSKFDINESDDKDPFVFKLIKEKRSEKELNLLHKYGLDFNTPNQKSQTPLIYLLDSEKNIANPDPFIEKKFLVILSHSLKTINHQDNYGETALFKILKQSSIFVKRNNILQEIFYHNPDLYIKNNNGQTFFDILNKAHYSDKNLLLKIYTEQERKILKENTQNKSVKKSLIL